ncbi:Protein MRPS-17 [Aphelenchoides avenae]|nr:Protein MRPS-17 [Aphelenchus avenae]
MSIARAAASAELLLGKVVKISQIGLKQIPCAQVRCQQNVFSDYLKKYFVEPKDLWALDSDCKSNIGDLVLIRIVKAEDRPTSTVTHSVDRVVFEFGNIIDPVTKRKVVEGHFSDELRLQKQLVEEIVEEPLKMDSLLFEERRAIQKEKLQNRKSTES